MHSMPAITTLRDWDFLLLKRYSPQYLKKEDECSLCTYGPCHINEKKKGVCGIGLNAHLSKMSLFTAVTGAAGHASLAESITSELIEKFGSDYPLKLNDEPLQTPLIRLICGFKPKVLSEMKKVTSYINREITSLLSVLNMGQEGEWIDFESKTLHAGMLDNLALEVIDMSRSPKGGVKIAGNQRDQLKFIKSGIANVIVLDSQCIRTDILHHASKMGIPVVATNPECSLGLPDRTGDKTEKIVDDLISQREAGVLIFDKKKIAQVAAETSIKRIKIPNSKFQIPNYKIRVGRGAISDIEIKNVAPPIVMGEIPGIIGFLGCPNYSHENGLLEMARALIDRDYIVTSGGC